MKEDFLELYENNSDAIFRYCYFRVYDRERALELSQEAFTKAWDYLSRTGKEIENLRAFIYKIAKNLIIDESKKKIIKHTSSLEDLREKGFDPANTGGDATKAIIDNKEAIKAIDDLEDKYKEVIKLRYMEDLSVKEIAIVLEESENNVSVRIHRALSKLRTTIPNG